MTDTITLFDKSLEIDKEIIKRKKKVTVLFADLPKSTEFKLKYGNILGLKRTFIHNSIVTNIVSQAGDIVKYIGDEVMALFSGSSHVKRALNIAIEIQQAFCKFNDEFKGHPAFPDSTKIGIHTGEVFFWNYSGHDQLDPQGTVVGIAARIVGLAKSNQILCSEQTFKSAKTSKIKTGLIAGRKLKGIEKPVKVVEVSWNGNFQGISYPVVPPSKNTKLRELVSAGLRHWESENKIAALEALKSAIEIDPYDFMANFLLGDYYLKSDQNIAEGLEYLNRAIEINPEHPCPWYYLGFQEWYRNIDKFSSEHINKAIQLTEQSIYLSELSYNLRVRLTAKNNLAYFLILRNDPGDLSKALQLCEQIYKGILRDEKIVVSHVLETFARALMKKGGAKNLDRARQFLEEGIKRNNQNPYLYETMSLLIKEEKKIRKRSENNNYW